MTRILILFLLVYLLIRLFIWLRNRTRFFFQGLGSRSRPQGNSRVIDEMKACPQCGTYNPTRSALAKKGLYFCNKRCHEAYEKREAS